MWLVDDVEREGYVVWRWRQCSLLCWTEVKRKMGDGLWIAKKKNNDGGKESGVSSGFLFSAFFKSFRWVEQVFLHRKGTKMSPLCMCVSSVFYAAFGSFSLWENHFSLFDEREMDMWMPVSGKERDILSFVIFYNINISSFLILIGR